MLCVEQCQVFEDLDENAFRILCTQIGIVTLKDIWKRVYWNLLEQKRINGLDCAE